MDYAIIAAGEGSRLVEEGVTTPKPLVRLLGEPMIDRLMGLFLRHGATSISVIVNEEMTDVQHHMEQLALPVPLNLVVRSTPSSMHSFHALRPFLTSDTCCLTTVDTVFREEPFAAYIDAFERSPLLDGMMAVTAYVDDEAPLYVRTDSAGMIRGFLDREEGQAAGCQYVSGGMYCLRRSALDVLDQAMEQGVSRMRNYQRMLVSEGLRLRAYAFDKILDIDHAADIAKAEAFLSTP
ncbi:nucleoside-diphosphate-sugar pyrophosphorylase [Tannerella sp. oral taxon BU063 isolate Cell 6/7/9]|uniref:Nucleoside-diphosphate-sugar pyrophosphorylase n=1 Tax=Tannerella sp. oral taxon BU063 isolate Cell 6/7/9 TaxID=1411021 RepID=W2CPY1_9BACT|nr:nucleoside-diphosphate-sugar pyrophosphorylase [Tannerella sp. oral taxon BU063 isolate Cell 6/7/9]RKW65505.1 MAG: NDP-sugar synthase [Tannerella sp.]